jgi:Tol biopolymer transport system component
MIRPGRWVAVVGSALVIAVAVGCASGAGAASKSAVSPCGTATFPAWSPDGTQIAWYGHRWPLPTLHHRGASYTVLRAICVMDANGKNIHRVPHTVCSQHCTNNMSEPLDQLYWRGTGLLYGNDFGTFAIPPGQKPKLLGKKPPEPFSVDSAGDRVAAGAYSSCTNTGCAWPVKVFGVPSGSVVGKAGGTKVINTEPSLSPSGTQVVFARFPAGDSGKRLGIWTASADGSHLKRLVRGGGNPLWSPSGGRIVYLAGAYPSALRLTSTQGGASTTLLRKGIGALFAWSPDGDYIAFADGNGKLAVLDVTTKKVRKLLTLRPPWGPSSIAWSPDSTQMLVVWRPPAHSKCPSGLWRVPINGAKPHLVHGC